MTRRKNTWRALRKAREFMHVGDICTLPIDPFELYKLHGWNLLRNSFVERRSGERDPFDIKKDNVDAYTFWKDGRYLTIYDDTKPINRIRWTLAHEIGHIFLGHLPELRVEKLKRNMEEISEEYYELLEVEANKFASELLTPISLLKEANITDKEYISSICQVSKDAATICENEILEQSYKTIHTEARSFYRRQFKEFLAPVNFCSSADIDIPFAVLKGKSRLIVQTTDRSVDRDQEGRFILCPECKNETFSDTAKYCKCCGLHLFHTPRILITRCNKFNPADAHHCEHCGAQTFSIKLGLLKHAKEILEENGENLALDWAFIYNL